jgi:hypothetical protein
MRQAASVVDLGTGGGERLLKLRKHWPEKVVVTEDYPPSAQEWSGRLAFTDVGAIVYYSKRARKTRRLQAWWDKMSVRV